MSDYVYGGKDNKQFFIPSGDSKFEVIGFEKKISGGDKTRGARIVQLKLQLDPSGVHCYAGLILHQSCGWKIDTFCKCTGIECPIGQMPPELRDGDERLLVGLRGWATFNLIEYKSAHWKEGDPIKKKNEVLVWITNKEKLLRKPPPSAEEVAKTMGTKARSTPAETDEPPF